MKFNLSESFDDTFEDWEYTLEEAVLNHNKLTENNISFSDIKEGSVLMSASDVLFNRNNKPYFLPAHRIFIVDKMKHTGEIVCHGYTFTSNTKRSNVNPLASKKDKQSHIFIDDFNNIFNPPENYPTHSCYIDLDSIVEIRTTKNKFDNKGAASKEFIEFVRKCRDNYIYGRDNSKLMWLGGREYINNKT